ncbi:MAG: diguanylate cyclase [Lachnospiraceae bacterium]|nr:diguanylate cyclase [Lachnospiraceae bacterium]
MVKKTVIFLFPSDSGFSHTFTPLTLSTGEVAELSVSAGGAAYPNKGEYFVSLCRSADAALYEVKQNGKGAFRVKG